MMADRGLRATPQRAGRIRRDLSILQALDWAFRVECAGMDFAEATRGEGDRVGVSTVWVMMQRGALGCQIDGGGTSAPHDDAQIIASYLAALPVARGGRAMAAQIASLARLGMVPDWMPDARPACVPRAWSGKGGRFARTEVVGRIVTKRRGREVVHDVLCCPVTYTSTAAQIGRARRNYLDWWGALLDLRGDLVVGQALRTIRLTAAMPPLSPWIRPDAVVTPLVDVGES